MMDTILNVMVAGFIYNWGKTYKAEGKTVKGYTFQILAITQLTLMLINGIIDLLN